MHSLYFSLIIDIMKIIYPLDMFCRKRGAAVDEFGRVGLGGTDEEEEGTSEVEAVLISRSEDIRKKSSAIDAMMSICEVRLMTMMVDDGR